MYWEFLYFSFRLPMVLKASVGTFTCTVNIYTAMNHFFQTSHMHLPAIEISTNRSTVRLRRVTDLEYASLGVRILGVTWTSSCWLAAFVSESSEVTGGRGEKAAEGRDRKEPSSSTSLIRKSTELATGNTGGETNGQKTTSLIIITS